MPVDIGIDNSWPDGLQTGVEKMRKGERAKIRIKRKHGFGRANLVEQLRFPKDYAEGDNRDRLMKEQIIYEVTVVDFVERYDMEANGIFLKVPIKKAAEHEF